MAKVVDISLSSENNTEFQIMFAMELSTNLSRLRQGESLHQVHDPEKGE
jgi:hypothetical protein